MDNRVPLHALGLILLRDAAHGLDVAQTLFPTHELLTPQRIATDLVGHPERPDLLAIILSEMQRRMVLKLSLGERVVISAPSLLRPAQRAAFQRLALRQGASVVFLLDAEEPRMAGVDPAEERASTALLQPGLQVVQPLGAAALVDVAQRFRGMTVLGDVHGDLA